jgi:hypothetical protein
MAGFDGTWDVEEHTFHGKRTLKDRPVRIIIERETGDLYKVTIPLKRGDPPLVFVAFPNDKTLSGINNNPIDGDYGVRLVFNHAVNPTQIVEGPLCSIIEWWHRHKDQPEDMGTITGQRVPLSPPLSDG